MTKYPSSSITGSSPSRAGGPTGDLRFSPNVNSVRLAVFSGSDQLIQVIERPLPTTLREGETLVEILLATICGSDLHTRDGRRKEPVPSVLGHEAVGRIVASGPGGTHLMPGDRVTWTSAASCGVCAPCHDWRLPQKCMELFKYGHSPLDDGSGLNGCYASHVLLRRGTSIFRVSDRLSDSVVAPVNCALATMVCATEVLPTPCRTAVVQGAGLLGLYGCALLRSKGVSRVLVVDTEATRLARVVAFGGEPVLASLRGFIPTGQVDAVFEVAGTSSVVPEGVESLRPGGSYTFIGMVLPGTPLALTGEAIIRKCLTIRGVHNYAPRHLESAVRFLEENLDLYPWSDLVSPPRPLADIETAFDETRRRTWPRVAVRP